jgi:hypothetical protein
MGRFAEKIAEFCDSQKKTRNKAAAILDRVGKTFDYRMYNV